LRGERRRNKRDKGLTAFRGEEFGSVELDNAETEPPRKENAYQVIV
jgi:hypothetical protein